MPRGRQPQEAYELRDTDGTPITVAQGRAIVAERFSIPTEIRNARRQHRTEATPPLAMATASVN
jgi:hypothetical protein